MSTRGTDRRKDSKDPESGSALGRLKRLNDLLKQQNRRLSLYERRYHKLFDMAGSGIIKTDMKGVIILANRMAGVILSSRRLKGRSLGSFLSPTSREALKRVLGNLAGGTSGVQEAEVEYPGGDGPRTLNLRAVPLEEEGRIEEAEIILTDITEGIRQQRLLKKLQERAIVAGLSRHLSHLLLNSLTSAGGQVRKLQRNATAKAPLKTSLAVIREELDRMEDVVRGYQDYVAIINLRAEEVRSPGDFLNEFLRLLPEGTDREMDRVLRPVRTRFEAGLGALSPDAAPVFIDAPFLRLGLAYLLRSAVLLAPPGAEHAVTVLLGTTTSPGTAGLTLLARGVRVREEAVATLYVPWEHQMLQQTFDDWGVAIANGVAERHHGGLEISITPEGVLCEIRLPAALGKSLPEAATRGR